LHRLGQPNAFLAELAVAERRLAEQQSQASGLQALLDASERGRVHELELLCAAQSALRLELAAAREQLREQVRVPLSSSCLIVRLDTCDSRRPRPTGQCSSVL
jgi:hypothetical protein